MHPIFKKIFKFFAFFGLGILLFWLAYKELDTESILQSLKEANLWWIFLSLFLGLLSHISRAMRWQILLETAEKKTGFLNTFFAVMVMYIANMAFPRLGELSRCSIMTKYEKLSFSKTLGTVVLERIIDMFVLLLLAFIVFVIQFQDITSFLIANISQKSRSFDMLKLIWLMVIIAAIGLVGIYLLFFKLKHWRISKKITAFLISFWDGMKTVAQMKKKAAFIFHSLFIFLMYYLMLYISFFAFDFTKDLDPLIALTVFVLASFGMVAPVPGGIGAWHFMVYETLAIYGVAVNPDGAAFAFAVHGVSTVFLIVMGFLSLVMLPVLNRRGIDK